MSFAGDDRTGALIDRLVEVCMDDERILAALLGGSRARGEADEFSDIDISVIVVDEAYPAFVSDKGSFAPRLGELLFVEDFGSEEVTFTIFAEGVELELVFVRRKDLQSLRSGPHIVLEDSADALLGNDAVLKAYLGEL